MWKIKLLTLLLVVVSAACLILKPQDWKRFSPANEHFTVLIPDDAEASNVVAPGFTFSTRQRTYSVQYFDASNSESAQNRMERLPNTIGGGSISGEATSLISERQLTFNGYSGREFKYGNKMGLHLERMLIVESRLYILDVYGDLDDRLLDRNAEKFFASFEVK